MHPWSLEGRAGRSWSIPKPPCASVLPGDGCWMEGLEGAGSVASLPSRPSSLGRRRIFPLHVSLPCQPSLPRLPFPLHPEEGSELLLGCPGAPRDTKSRCSGLAGSGCSRHNGAFLGRSPEGDGDREDSHIFPEKVPDFSDVAAEPILGVGTPGNGLGCWSYGKWGLCVPGLCLIHPIGILLGITKKPGFSGGALKWKIWGFLSISAGINP